MRIEGRKQGGEEGVIWRMRRRPACRLLRQALSRNAETPSASCAPPSTGWLPLLCSEIQTKSQTNTDKYRNKYKYRQIQKCRKAKCIMCNTLDRFSSLSDYLKKYEDFEKL